jgi:cytochrome c-type biogenesis protein CcmH/NrfF
MPVKLRLRSKILLAVLLTISVAQSTVPLTNERVRRLGDLLHCKCGCQASITGCNMLNCHFADPVRLKLLAMVEAGKSDKEVFDAMVAEFGTDILQKPPAEGFFLLSYVMPYVGLGAGLAFLYWLLTRYLRRRPAAASAGSAAPEAESPELARYKERIERDLSDLE